jgi:hypothetical protein
MSVKSKVLSLILLPALLLFAIPVAVAKPVCGAWSGYTSQGKKEKTINGVKHTCDASTRSRSCCEYGQQTTCSNENQTRYENCTPARTAPGTLRPKITPTVPPDRLQQ